MANRPERSPEDNCGTWAHASGSSIRTVMGLHVADDRKRARATDMVQRSVDHGKPVPDRESLGNGCLGIAHPPAQAVAGGLEFGAGDRISLPAPPPGLGRQLYPVTIGEDRRPAHRNLVEAQRLLPPRPVPHRPPSFPPGRSPFPAHRYGSGAPRCAWCRRRTPVVGAVASPRADGRGTPRHPPPACRPGPRKNQCELESRLRNRYRTAPRR